MFTLCAIGVIPGRLGLPVLTGIALNLLLPPSPADWPTRSLRLPVLINYFAEFLHQLASLWREFTLRL
jgi:hypothetical protein